jgi:isopentenyl diphosphate isomerase/L-lactate dehydrogenase-like FMN-dependent dehydrogenase
VAAAAKGRLAILVDGGVRDGADVLKMVALGADAVMIGRPVSVAAIGGLSLGVEKYMAALKAQLTQAMVLTGSADIASVTSRVLYAG